LDKPDHAPLKTHPQSFSHKCAAAPIITLMSNQAKADVFGLNKFCLDAGVLSKLKTEPG
jgi:hypothetical protein